VTPVHILQGVPASVGIAIGQAVQIDTRKIERFPKIRITEAFVNDEIKRFEEAVCLSYQQIEEARQKLERQKVSREHVLILETHLLMLKDPSLNGHVQSMIRTKLINAEWALRLAMNDFEERFQDFGDEYIKSRISDTSFVGERVMRNLTGREINRFHLLEKSIIVAHDLSPADTAMMDKSMVLGFATDVGGMTSHTAIIARSLEIPAVVGLENASEINPGDTVILDGITGTLIINPTANQIAEYEQRAKSYQSMELKLREKAKQPAVTKDGLHMVISGNLEFQNEIKTVLAHGAEGIGLYRTEFLYLNRDRVPSEEDHFQAYKTVVETVSPYNTVIRTLDLGGDKLFSSLGQELKEEINPAMGLRAIRLCLKEVDIFRTQLRGILRASHYGHTSIMFPMISGMEELMRAKEILEQTKDELRRQGIPFDEDIAVGIMIEVPSAAIIADILAKEVDFFSIGTNDLIQYSLAIDRGNEHVNYLYDPLHPAVLRMVKMTVEAGHNAGITVSMCGEMAGRTVYTPLLLGLGVDRLSTNAFAIAHIKEMIRHIDISKCRSVADHVLELKTSAEIEAFMRGEVLKHSPQIFDL